MWYCLIKAHNLDPGFLPKNTDAYDQALKQVCEFFKILVANKNLVVVENCFIKSD